MWPRVDAAQAEHAEGVPQVQADGLEGDEVTTSTPDWRTLPAGRSLDALVAERVMDWKWFDVYPIDSNGRTSESRVRMLAWEPFDAGDGYGGFARREMSCHGGGVRMLDAVPSTMTSPLWLPRCSHVDEFGEERDPNRTGDVCYCDLDDRACWSKYVPRYSEDIGAAWLVWERVKAECKSFESMEWWVFLHDHAGLVNAHDTCAQELWELSPLAIVRAALAWAESREVKP